MFSSNRHSALDVSKYFLYINTLDSYKKGDLTNKKLQKLLYYTQAWSLVFRNKPLFKEKIEAWIHGPAIPSVYAHYKHYGRLKIDFDENDIEPLLKKFDKEEKELIDLIWNVYGEKDANYLECLTHSEDPWNFARRDISVLDPSNKEITHDSMKKYYTKLFQHGTKTEEKKESS
jgi:uncharacterized phage-associated protein